MKLRTFLLSVAASLLLTMASAQASSQNIYTLDAGDSGSDLYSATMPVLAQEYVGMLAPHTKVTFSYNLFGAAPLGSYLSSLGYTASSSDHFVQAETIGGLRASSDGLVMATANLDPVNFSGETTITNLSAGLINIKTSFVAVVFSGVNLLVSYVATPASVPVPAALPLFGLGLASLAGVRARKSKKAA